MNRILKRTPLIFGIFFLSFDRIYGAEVPLTSMENTTSNNTLMSLDFTPFLTEVIYSNENKTSDDHLSARGMKPLYAITSLFVELVGSSVREDIPVDLLPASDGSVGEVMSYVKQWLYFERGIVTVAAIGLSLAVLVPIFGLLFCCCRCCGRCGASPEKKGARSKPCHCGSLTVLFLLLSILITFGVICAFVTTENQHQTVNQVRSTVDSSLGDVKLYVDHSRRHASHVLTFNFKELEEHIKETLNVTELRAEKEFENGVVSVGADQLFSFAERIAKAVDDITQLNNSFDRLRGLEDGLEKKLATIRGNLSVLVQSCRQRLVANPNANEGNACSVLDRLQNNLSLGVTFRNLSVSGALMEFGNSIDPNVIAAMKEAKDKLQSVRGTIRSNVLSASDMVREKLEQARLTVLRIESDMRQMATTAMNQLNRAEEIVMPYFGYVEQYNQYIWYGKLAMSVLAILVLCAFILAACFGICGSRPGTLYEDPCCNKGKGSCLLLSGVSLIFLLFFFVMVITTALFVIGSNVQLLGCDNIANTSANNHVRALNVVLRQYKLIDEIDLPVVAGQLRRCNENRTLFDVLQLKGSMFNESDLELQLRKLDVFPAVADLVANIQKELRRTEFMRPEQKNALMQAVQDPRLNRLDLEPIINQLSVDRILLNDTLTALIAAVETLIPQLQQGYNVQFDLDQITRETLPEIQNEMESASRRLSGLSSLLANGSLSETILHFIRDTEEAQQIFATRSGTAVQEIANDTVVELRRYVDEYIQFALGELHNRIGRCQPASAAINRTVDAVCVDVLQPFNGFWLSMGWTLVLFVIILPIAIALAWHFRVPDRYRSGSTESDFETTTVADTIPLAKRPRRRVSPTSNGGYDSSNRQSKTTQWAFHNAFKNQQSYLAAGYNPVQKGSTQSSTNPAGPSAPLPDDFYTRPPSYYYPGSN